MILVLHSVPAFALTEVPAVPAVNARSIYVMDARTGTELYAKQPEEFISAEDLLPMLIAMTVLERKNPDDYLLITQAAQQTTTSITGASGDAGLRAGERLAVRQLLSALLLANSQDAVVALAEVFEDDAAFVTALQDKAAELQLDRTLIASYMADSTTATGHTTVRDLGKAARAFLEDPLLVELSGQASYTFIPNNMVPEPRTIDNENLQLAEGSEYHREDLLFGFQTQADPQAPLENSYVGAAQTDTGRFIVALSGSESVQVNYTNSSALFDWAFQNFQSHRLISQGDVISSMPLEDAQLLDLVAESDVYHLMSRSALKPEFSLSFIPGDYLAQQIEKDQLMGIADVLVDDKVIASVNLLASRAVDLSTAQAVPAESLLDKALRWGLISGVILLFIGTIILIIRTVNLMKRSRNRQAELRANRKALLAKRRAEEKAREKQQVINRSNF